MLTENIEDLIHSAACSRAFVTEGPGDFFPKAPLSREATGLSESLVESLILKFLLNRTMASGQDITSQLQLPFRVVETELRRMKLEQLLTLRNSSQLHDYIYELTPAGYERAERANRQATYFGAAPVCFDDYVRSVEAQRLNGTEVTPARLLAAMQGLAIQQRVFQQIGQAVRAARALFLFGAPGNGKTSIAERICKTFGPSIWIPRTLIVDGELIRFFDPTMHRPTGEDDNNGIDRRWIKIERPTIVAGGELTLENLELTRIGDSGIVEAPLQFKSNCGVLVIDDFGRQRVSPTDLLNRWIVPLETKVDYLNLPSGKKLRTPFEQMIVFSTNLRPRDLVDEAFLRRIPYKIEAPNPSEMEFLKLLQTTAGSLGVAYEETAGLYLLEQHFRRVNRELRYCHARDLLQQVKTACEFQGDAPRATAAMFDQAVLNYFVDLD